MNRWNMIWYIQYRVLAFCKHILEILKKHAPLKEKSKSKQLYVCKAIMKGSELGNLFLKQKSEVLGRVYTRHKNNRGFEYYL